MARMFEKGELKELWPFYIEKFLSHILYFAPAFWILQFQQNFSLLQIGILFSIVSITAFLSEIPTGAIADIYGRKFSTLIGYFLTAIILVFFSFVKDFNWLVVLFVLWGIAGTFYSGAKEAWIVDKLKSKRKSHLIRDYYIKNQSLMKASMFVSGFLGAFIVSRMGLNAIWAFAALSFFVSGIILSFIGEERVTKEKPQTFRMLFVQARDSIRYSWKHHVLFFLLLATFFIMLRDAFGGDIVWQPFLRSLGLPISAFGILFSAAMLIGIVTPFFAKRLVKKFGGERESLSFLVLCSIILDLAVILAGNVWFGMAILLGMYIAIDLYYTIGDSYFQKHVPSKMRATITSLKGMMISIGYTISFALSGLFANWIGPQKTIVLGAVFLVPAFFLYLRIREKKK